MQLSGADIIIKVLIEQGVDTVFGYPGGQIINVYDSLYKYSGEIKHVLTAHEQGAAHAADGYARATGRTGVVISTSGPGATNLVTGIATAFLDSVPVVAITGNVPTTQIGYDSFQEIDITGITLPITKHNYFVSDVKKLADTLREAFALAASGRPGPVLVDVPKDVQTALCEYSPCQPVTGERQKAKEERIIRAAEIINASERPYIYFGGGLISSGAEEQLLELADKIDAPIGCSMMGISGIPTDNPRFLGMQGMHGHYASSMAMHHADCVIALGVRFNDRVTGDRSKFAARAKKVVHIDVDGSELNKTVGADCGIRADVKDTLVRLIPKLRKTVRSEWRGCVTRLKEQEEEYSDNRSGFTPKNIMSAVNRFKDADTPVATDVGQHQMWAAQYLAFGKPRKFISSGGLGTMGFGMGAAIGAAFGTGKRTVLITGDGSFGMCMNELATAVTYDVPLVILIMNNGVLGMVRQWQTLFFDKRYSNTVLERKTDFVKVAAAFGAAGERATTPDELSAALGRAFKSRGPYLIDCAVDKDEFVLPMLPPGGSMDDIIVRTGE